MRQYAGFGNAEESNRRYKFLLASGQTGLSVAFDLPTQMGRDSDHPLARGEVGRVGRGDLVDRGHARPARRHPAGRGLDVDDDQRDRGDAARAVRSRSPTSVASRARALSGTIQNDILKEYIARGTYIYPPGPSLRLCADTFAFCQAEVPRWNTISISGYHIREAGSDAVQEVAFTLADGIAYVEAARDAGLAVDDFAPRLSFFFNAHANLLEEIAKFRAARRLWARIMRDRFGRNRPARADAPVSRADRGLDADGGAAAQQRRAHDDRGAGRRAGRRPVAAHERLRRGAGAADGGIGAPRPAHAADPRRRDRRRQTSSIPSAARTPSRR